MWNNFLELKIKHGGKSSFTIINLLTDYFRFQADEEKISFSNLIFQFNKVQYVRFGQYGVSFCPFGHESWHNL